MESVPTSRVIRVAIDVPVFRLFDYLIDPDEPDPVGLRVRVPFGKKVVTGVVMECIPSSEFPEELLKSPIRICRDIPPLNEDLLALFFFCSRYYHHPIGQVVLNALPSWLKSDRDLVPMRNRSYALTESGMLARLTGKNLLELREHLLQAGFLDEAAIRKTFPAATLSRMKERGFVTEVELPFSISKAPELGPEQSQAVLSILGNPDGYRPWLLHGITGSGKSEVYLRTMERVLKEGSQVLFLVPEIGLTPMLENLIRSRFPFTPLVSLHSGLADGARMQCWLQAQAGIARIVLGTRLAAFVPLANPGLIIVDEEHDPSFKQQEGLRYSARDLAIFRAKQLSIPIILGSATPSLESYHKAKTGRYGYLAMKSRAARDALLPSIRLVDLRRYSTPHGISSPLAEAISARLDRQEQSLLFVNRRGYSPALICSGCTWSPTCGRCSARLVLHLRERKLRCHYCGHTEDLVQSCPSCGNIDLKPVGHGTQRIEQTLSGLFPEARILRIDRDNLLRKSSFQDMLKIIDRGEVDILVGTQILAKGHNFPNLTLVGILQADSSLYSCDFRASERLFSLLTQVSGRAGRATLPGEVLIQTEFPDHPLFTSLIQHDYDAMANLLLSEREAGGFPPFSHQALIRAESPSVDHAHRFLRKVEKSARSLAQGVTVFEPVSAFLPRMNSMERMQILLQSQSRKSLQNMLDLLIPSIAPDRSVRWHIDVDPLEF